jgi:GTPase SAR1 family protein
MSYVKNPERIADKDQLSGYAGLDASGNGHVGTTHLGDGSANAATFLRGDQTWAVPPSVSGNVAVKVIDTIGDANYNALTTDYLIIADALAVGAPVQITLPDASSNSGKIYVIKKTDPSATPVTYVGSGTDTIDDDASGNLIVQYDSVTLISGPFTGFYAGKWQLV